MSHVRMCDKCSIVFSELESGWQSFTATTIETDEKGQSIEIKQAMDACPSCALIPKRQFQRELAAHAGGDELAARIAKLERETGVVDAEPVSG